MLSCATITKPQSGIHPLLRSPARVSLLSSAPAPWVSLRLRPLADFRVGFPLEGFRLSSSRILRGPPLSFPLTFYARRVFTEAKACALGSGGAKIKAFPSDIKGCPGGERAQYVPG